MENKLTKAQTTSQALWKDSNAGTVSLLRDGKFDQLAKSVPNRVSELLDCEPLQSLISHAGSETVKAYLESELIKLAANFNGNPALNLKDYQVPVIADMLIENYRWESIEDFTLCFRKASAGLYGEIYRIDGAVIGQWFSRYLDEKYDALEQRKAKEKPESQPRATSTVDASKYLDEWLKSIGGDPEKKDENNSKANAYQRFKHGYQPQLTEEHKRKILKQEFPEATEEQIQELLKKM